MPISWTGTSGCSYSSGARVLRCVPSLLCHCSSRALQWLCRLQAAFRIMWNKLRRSRTFLQCKFMLQTPVLLAELWLDARSCLEMGSAKFDRVELADEGALVLLIICVVSQGKCYFLFSSNTVCSARTVHQIPALVSSYSRCLKRRSQIPPQIPPQNCLPCLSRGLWGPLTPTGVGFASQVQLL